MNSSKFFGSPIVRSCSARPAERCSPRGRRRSSPRPPRPSGRCRRPGYTLLPPRCRWRATFRCRWRRDRWRAPSRWCTVAVRRGLRGGLRFRLRLEAAEPRLDRADDALLDHVRRQPVQRPLERVAGVNPLAEDPRLVVLPVDVVAQKHLVHLVDVRVVREHDVAGPIEREPVVFQRPAPPSRSTLDPSSSTFRLTGEWSSHHNQLPGGVSRADIPAETGRDCFRRMCRSSDRTRLSTGRPANSESSMGTFSCDACGGGGGVTAPCKACGGTGQVATLTSKRRNRSRRRNGSIFRELGDPLREFRPPISRPNCRGRDTGTPRLGEFLQSNSPVHRLHIRGTRRSDIIQRTRICGMGYDVWPLPQEAGRRHLSPCVPK
jgi:hypothetical protein